MSQNQPDKTVYVIVDSNIGELSQFSQFLVDEFQAYKTESLNQSGDNFSAPNEGIQAKTPGVHNMFGRDRIFDHPHDLLHHIVSENVAHVHVDPSGEAWDESLPQWSCTSHESIVYSAFVKPNGDYFYVIHDMLLMEEDPDFNAHDYYSYEDVEWYVKNAIYHRRQHDDR